MGNLKCLSSAVVAAAVILTGPPARAALSDATLAPLFFPVGSAELRLEAQATGALFGPHQPQLGWGTGKRRHPAHAPAAARPSHLTVLRASPLHARLRARRGGEQ